MITQLSLKILEQGSQYFKSNNDTDNGTKKIPRYVNTVLFCTTVPPNTKKTFSCSRLQPKRNYARTTPMKDLA